MTNPHYKGENERLIHLIQLFFERPRLTAPEISAAFGTTTRTSYNLLNRLNQCGVRVRNEGAVYSLDRTAPFFRHLRDEMTFTRDEAEYLCAILADVDSYRAQTLRAKLVRNFGITAPDGTTEEGRRVVALIDRLRSAMRRKTAVVLEKYSSPHSHTVSDRTVEPFLFLSDQREVRCYELASGLNKTFKVPRIGAVRDTGTHWSHEAEHRDVFTDVFMFCGEERLPVSIVLGQLARHVLVEEYPHAEPLLTELDQGRARFQTDVASYLGVGRFVLGLYDDVQVEGSPEFKEYLRQKIQAMRAAE